MSWKGSRSSSHANRVKVDAEELRAEHGRQEPSAAVTGEVPRTGQMVVRDGPRDAPVPTIAGERRISVYFAGDTPPCIRYHRAAPW